MVIDSSALIAILSDENDAPALASAIALAVSRRISAATLLETAMVIEARHGRAGGDKLDEFIQTAQITIEAVTLGQIDIARDAFRRYGKGRGHAAGLNFGDCFSYALAKDLGEPLLFKGDDFSKTDIGAASAS